MKMRTSMWKFGVVAVNFTVRSERLARRWCTMDSIVVREGSGRFGTLPGEIRMRGNEFQGTEVGTLAVRSYVSLDTAVPDEYVKVLFEARQFRVELQVPDDPQWQPHGGKFSQWATAYRYALGMAIGSDNQQRQDIADIRVVPEL